MSSLPPEIAALLSLIAVVISGLLRTDRQPAWVNALISFFAMILISASVVWLVNGFTSDIRTDVMLVVSGVTGYRELSVLLQFLESIPSSPPSQATMSPQRASLQPPGNPGSARAMAQNWTPQTVQFQPQQQTPPPQISQPMQQAQLQQYPQVFQQPFPGQPPSSQYPPNHGG